MRRFRHFFVMLFVASTLLGAMHEIVHHHHDMDNHVEESCPIYLLTQTIALPTEAYQLPLLALVYEPFIGQSLPKLINSIISSRSRSPPLS
ncbi:hypothetical protein [Sulfuricurvum sp.]|uniref:hypothetical protein n=1 Tax=Sulfuricurvum sp. TaxID=2025608 RepID=UPI002607163C|nr:hypothetical protein [Sulfuricurvum sp.]MDD2780187.1 hypothetical protein [Sulfuricurvum sp.]